MNLKFIFNLVFGVFSFDPKNMRWFNIRRVLVVVFILPVFLFLLINNRIFLLLDNLFFPFFRNQKVVKPVFIIAAPRSGTTYLYHLLAKNNDRYTYFKLWEIVFAPSIIQKYVLLGIIKIDRIIGSPMKHVILTLENVFIGNLKSIHLIGLNLPEEDEAVLIWSLSTIYLNFFYPDSNFFDDYLLFDKALPGRSKKRIMNQYNNYIKRHNFVFNRRGDKQFLSKNPLMMSKVAGVYSVFPDALVLNINRCPSEVIPSTIGLNNTIYSLFTSKKTRKDLNERTQVMLVEWYLMAEEAMNNLFGEQVLRINFLNMVTGKDTEISSICNFLDIDESSFPKKDEKIKSDKKHKSKNKYERMSNEKLDEILAILPFMKNNCE